ncbi:MULTISPECIES: hypothetical protein [unclassified Aureimonas]|uniref:hypothetical protein n=1 Tax=unclassified Aureimonas TaxID=2615206 RepID=UPI000B1A1859|nr:MULTISPECIES: hypothetical protein [unclassified Aureimonas]
MAQEAFAPSLIFEAFPELRFKPATRCENACASGTAIIPADIPAIKAGHTQTVLVISAETMTFQLIPRRDPRTWLRRLLKRSGGGQAKPPAVLLPGHRRLFRTLGDASATLTTTAVKNHAKTLRNSRALDALRRQACPLQHGFE